LLSKKAKKAAKEIADKQKKDVGDGGSTNNDDEAGDDDVIFKVRPPAKMGLAATEAVADRQVALAAKRNRRNLIMRRRNPGNPIPPVEEVEDQRSLVDVNMKDLEKVEEDGVKEA
jgi:hypothetical protein